MNHEFTRLFDYPGNKSQMGDSFMGLLPDQFGVIHIGFCGRLDLLQHLRNHGYSGHVFASDIFPQLVTTHSSVRDVPEEVISVLEKHRRLHSDEYFLDVCSRFSSDTPSITAANLIYISRCTFKGIIKISNNGRCTNSNARPTFNFSPDTVRKHSCFLQSTTLTAEDFAATAMKAKPGDLVLYDPPYFGDALVHGCLRFTDADHIRLANVCRALDRKGVLFLLNNSDTPYVRHIYRDFCIQTIEAPRTLGRVKNEGKAKELVITNY